MKTLPMILTRLRHKSKQLFFLRSLYRETFVGDEENESGRLVLEDLAHKFGWHRQTTLVTGAGSGLDGVRAQAFYEGQRSVWLYIQQRLHMSDLEIQRWEQQAVESADPLALGGTH